MSSCTRISNTVEQILTNQSRYAYFCELFIKRNGNTFSISQDETCGQTEGDDISYMLSLRAKNV